MSKFFLVHQLAFAKREAAAKRYVAFLNQQAEALHTERKRLGIETPEEQRAERREQALQRFNQFLDGLKQEQL